MSRMGKSVETEISGCQGLRDGRGGTGVSFGTLIKKFRNKTVVMATGTVNIWNAAEMYALKWLKRYISH